MTKEKKLSSPEWPFDLFAEELLNQCIFSLITYDDLISLTKKELFDSNRFWNLIHSFLVNVGNISKLLNIQSIPRKTIDPNLDQVQKSLQKYFDIDSTSLIVDRRIRNHFEHYDERLFNWASNSESSIMITYHIGSVKENLGDFFDPDREYKIYKRYDHKTCTLEFNGDKLNLDLLSDEIIVLKNKLEDYFPNKKKYQGINIQ
jgi:hypothetical protein